MSGERKGEVNCSLTRIEGKGQGSTSKVGGKRVIGETWTPDCAHWHFPGQ